MLRAASTVLIAVALFSFAMGVVYAMEGSLLAYHEDFLGMTMQDIADFSPELATLAGIFVRLAGTLFISVGVLLIAVIHFGLKKAERWAWFATLIGMGVINAPLVAITRPVGGFPWFSAIAMLVVFVLSIALAGREVFRKAPERPGDSVPGGR